LCLSWIDDRREKFTPVGTKQVIEDAEIKLWRHLLKKNWRFKVEYLIFALGLSL
jgi:hypothetical protein